LGLKSHQSNEACGVSIDWIANLGFFVENNTSAHVEAYVFPFEAKSEIASNIHDSQWLISIENRKYIKRHILSKEEAQLGVHTFENLQSGNIYVFRLTGRQGANSIDLRSAMLEVPRMFSHDLFTVDREHFPYGVKIRNPHLLCLPPAKICYVYSDKTHEILPKITCEKNTRN
jgi:hypothetical protein